MANVLNGILKGCETNLGGIKKIYFLPLDDIYSVQMDANKLVTDLQLEPFTSFVEWQILSSTANYSINSSVDSIGVLEHTHSLNLRLTRRDYLKNIEILNILQGKRDWVILVKDMNNLWWFLGWNKGINANSSDGGSGQSKPDGSQYNLSFSGVQPYSDLNVEESIIENLLLVY